MIDKGGPRFTLAIKRGKVSKIPKFSKFQKYRYRKNSILTGSFCRHKYLRLKIRLDPDFEIFSRHFVFPSTFMVSTFLLVLFS